MPTVQQTWILVKKKTNRKQESQNGLYNLWDTLYWTFHLVYQQFLLVDTHLLYGPLCKVLAFNKHWTVPLLRIISSPLMLALYPPNLALGNKILRLIQGSFVSFETALWHQASCQISWITQGWREERKAKHFIPLMWTLRCSWGCSSPPWWWSLQSPTARRLAVPSPGRPLWSTRKMPSARPLIPGCWGHKGGNITRFRTCCQPGEQRVCFLFLEWGKCCFGE